MLMDFGISHLLSTVATKETATRASKGTTRWMAPELLSLDSEDSEKSSQDSQLEDNVHTKESDVYALGMTYYVSRR